MTNTNELETRIQTYRQAAAELRRLLQLRESKASALATAKAEAVRLRAGMGAAHGDTSAQKTGVSLMF